MKESEGDLQGAINLYLKAGLPAKAARLALSHTEITNSSDVVSRIATSLIKGEFYERVSGLDSLATLLGTDGEILVHVGMLASCSCCRFVHSTS